MYSEGEAYSQTCFWTPVNYQSASYSTGWFGSSCGSTGVQCDPEDLLATAKWARPLHFDLERILGMRGQSRALTPNLQCGII